MKWLEVTVLTNTQGSELVGYILSELGSEGVSIYDSNDLVELIKSDVIWDYVDEHLLVKNEVVQVKGYYDCVNGGEIVSELHEKLEELRRNSDGNIGSLEILSREIADEDWINVWKKYYEVLHIGKIVIVPVWLKYEPKEDEIVVLMDPGRAFGTGEHESTQLCLSMLGDLDVTGETVLDIGCGSGILGITAYKCGAKQVYLSDIDDIAVQSARENANLNGIASGISISNSDLLSGSHVKGQLIFANITADILIKLSSAIGGALEDGGHIILSGIIKKRYDEVLEAYLAKGFTLIKSLERGEWRGILLKK